MSPIASEVKASLGTAALYRFWGGLDILYLLSYAYFALAKGKMPFVDDAVATIQTLTEFGEIGGVIYESLYLMLFLSLAVSGVMLLLKQPAGKLVAYVQTPFRLVFMVPSVSLITLAIPYFELSNTVLLTALGLSEVSKIGSLLRWG